VHATVTCLEQWASLFASKTSSQLDGQIGCDVEATNMKGGRPNLGDTSENGAQSAPTGVTNSVPVSARERRAE